MNAGITYAIVDTLLQVHKMRSSFRIEDVSSKFLLVLSRLSFTTNDQHFLTSVTATPRKAIAVTVMHEHIMMPGRLSSLMHYGRYSSRIFYRCGV
jgi:hypothetical protein